ncbi:MAG: 50S ribosomal protein L18 [Candidatus Hermodarchaeota archaeon]|nr:50S ribosomal protein L18 [Candidatus Hermodarchaeota archaeon]
MATGPRYKVPFRRRRESKTDYRARRRMISSGHPRLVVRKTGTRIIVQVMEARLEGDRCIAAADSRQLKNYGWQAGTKNTPSAYLTGFLAGKKSIKAGTTSAIVDLGLVHPIPNSCIFSAIKGAIDAGLSIPCSEKMFPPEKRLRGEHIASYAKDLSKNQPSAFQRQFGKITKGPVDLTTLPSMYDTVKSAISTKHTSGRSTQ